MDAHGFVVRYSEIFIKKGNRRAFETQLLESISRIFANQLTVQRQHGRIFIFPRPESPKGEAAAISLPVFSPLQQKKIIDRFHYLFGYRSISPFILAQKDMADLSQKACQLALAFKPEIQSFQVSVNRGDKKFPLPSPEIERILGKAILDIRPLKVNLTRPDQVVEVEIGERYCFVFSERYEGYEGLPVGISGRVLLMLSGGIDSPVAAFQMLKRGCHVGAIYFHSFPYTGEKAKEKVIEIARLLARYQGRLDLFIAPFTDIQKTIIGRCSNRLAVILYRRMMARIARAVALEQDYFSLVTGENLGQVASQTLENLRAISSAVDMDILRPLLTWNKNEIITAAKAIETFPLSTLPYDDCCSLWVPKHPETHADIAAVLRAEGFLEIEALVQDCLARLERISLAYEFPPLWTENIEVKSYTNSPS